jgi:hypothetical protein
MLFLLKLCKLLPSITKVLTPYQAYRLWQCYNLTEDYVLEHTERLVAIKISNIPKFYARFLINGVDDWSLLKDAYE